MFLFWLALRPSLPANSLDCAGSLLYYRGKSIRKLHKIFPGGDCEADAVFCWAHLEWSVADG